MSSSNKPRIVFAHGLWADGSCFSKLITPLQAEGYEVVSTQNSLDSLEGDVAAVRRALGRVSSPAILVGHSQGGTIITAAGIDDRTVNPELQRFVAKRMGATIYEADSSHVPMLSKPSLVLDVIRTAANAIQGVERTA